MADLTQTPSSVVATAGYKGREVLAGATIVAGNVVYEDGTNGLKLAKGDAVSTAGVAGIALNGGGDGQPILICTSGVINVGATMTLGEHYALSAGVAGKIGPVSDLASTNSPTTLGVAITTTTIQLAVNISGILHA